MTTPLFAATFPIVKPKTHILSKAFETAYRDFHSEFHRDRDPISRVYRYKNPEDQEIIAFLAASVSYGNVKYILNTVDEICREMGPNPRERVEAGKLPNFSKIVHRWTLGIDIEIIAHWVRGALKRHGSLEQTFCNSQENSMQTRIADFVAQLKSQVLPRRLHSAALTRKRNLEYLIPNPSRGSACKRLNMFLRWMVRPSDGIDLGLWNKVSPSELMLPIDTHVLKSIRKLGWTESKTANWKAVEAATLQLRKLDAFDPIRFDFSLCHLSMEGHDLEMYL